MLFYLWISVLIVSLFLEFITLSALVSIWFALGSIAALIALELRLSFMFQVIIFALVSLLTLLTIRPLAKKFLRGNKTYTNQDRFIGRVTTLLKPISLNSWGEVEIDGVIWSATTIDQSSIEENSLVEVLAIEGAKLIVKKI